VDLLLNDDQEALRESVARFLAKASSPERVRAAEPGGFDPAVWQGLADMGVPVMAVPEHLGGGGASLADVAVVVHQCGLHLAPAPVVETVVGNRLLAALGRELDESAVTTLALRPPVGRTARLVPGASVATAVLALDGDRVVLAERTVDPLAAGGPRNLGNAPLADVDLAAAVEVASGPEATSFYAIALDEWRALTALWLHGVGRAALDIGVQYTKERQQFGVPIATFQSVAHRLADLHTDLDGAWLLAQKAVWALDEGEQRGPEFASGAFIFSGETAERSAAAALHYHGGYGFMEEYDIQLYFRRAKATRLLLGDPGHELQVLADRLWGPPEQASA